MQEEFYTRPILAVSDVTASISYYCEKLGFEEMWRSPADSPIIAQVGRHGLEIILDSQSAIPKASIPSVLSMSLHQPERLGEIYQEFQTVGQKLSVRRLKSFGSRGYFN